MIVYLHGFKSSPESLKAQQLRQRVAAEGMAWYCPQLPVSPKAAVAGVMQYLSAHAGRHESLTIVGSSLGGFYAVWIAEQLGCRAVLLNPMVKMPDHPESLVGKTQDMAGHTLEVKPAYLEELQHYIVPQISHPERYLLLASTADEVLNCQDMVTYFKGAKQILIEGDSHRMSQFDQYMDDILAFIQEAGRPSC